MSPSKADENERTDRIRLFTGWKGEMQHQVDMFSRESGDHELKDNEYLILKSNIHVTLAMTRLRLM